MRDGATRVAVFKMVGNIREDSTKYVGGAAGNDPKGDL